MTRQLQAFVLTVLTLIIAACAADGHRRVQPGVVDAGQLRVTVDEGWRRAPSADTPEKRNTTRVFTREGVEYDRLYIIIGVESGQTLFRADAGLRPYRAGMSETEIAELVAESLQAVLWGGVTVTAGNVEPHGFTGIPGLKFDLAADVSGATTQKGMAGVLFDDETLYAVIFLAESPGRYERNAEAAREIIDSAILTVKTIRR